MAGDRHPKATLLRILQTAHDHGMVWQRLGDGAFLPSHSLDRFREPDDPGWIVEIASPVMERLVRKAGWPSVLGVPRATVMEIRETNSKHALVDDIVFTRTPYRANMLRSASGRAYISHCDPRRREAILDQLRHDDEPGHALAHDSAGLEAMIRGARARGYALRHPDFGGSYGLPRSAHDDGRQSMAVPIRRGYAIATINITWRRTAMPTQRAVNRHLGDLKEAAAEIETLIERQATGNGTRANHRAGSLHAGAAGGVVAAPVGEGPKPTRLPRDRS